MRIDLLQLGLKFADDQQTFVPQMLKLGRDNSILWVHSMILSLGSVTLVAYLLESQLNLPAHVVCFAIACLNGTECRFYTHRLQLPEDLDADALIDPQCTKRDAQLASMQMRLAVASRGNNIGCSVCCSRRSICVHSDRSGGGR